MARFYIDISSFSIAYTKLDKNITPINITFFIKTSPKKIKVVFHKYVDVCIPFDEISINHNETLEFLFANAHYGIKEYFVPNEMLLTITRRI